MTRKEFAARIAAAPLLMDGATGTELIRRGMPPGVCPEAWILKNPSVFLALQEEYLSAGSQMLLIPSFGANEYRLAAYGLGDRMHEMNMRLAGLTLRAAGNRVPAAADIGPTGRMMSPLGPSSFDETAEAYVRQARALLEAGAELFVLETFADFSEIRAAILGIRSACDLPIVAAMAFGNGRTLHGADPEAAALAMACAGADAVGANCSQGPMETAPVVAAMARVAGVPIFAKPNAGPPGGPTGPEEFARDFRAVMDAGAHIAGGCCGTGPAHVAALANLLEGRRSPAVPPRPACLGGPRHILRLSPDMPLAPVGERINPTGKPALRRALREGNYEPVLELARLQRDAGAPILDVNCGTGEGDEARALSGAVEQLSAMVPLPLSIDTGDPAAMESALRRYPGRALMNAVTARTGVMDRLLTLCVRYGAVPVLLPLGDGPPPARAEDRMALLDVLLEAAGSHGIEPWHAVADVMVMAAAADPGAARETLRFAAMCRERGLVTLAGVSNVSFGLPRRPALNRAFLSALAAAGLNLAIVNPCEEGMDETLAAANLLTGRDETGLEYVRKMK